MSGPPKSIWLMVHESPWYSTHAHESQSGAEYSADKTASVGLPRPTVVRYDLADAERDKRDADAIDVILDATRPQTTEALNAFLIRLGAARKRLEALRDRLRGGAR